MGKVTVAEVIQNMKKERICWLSLLGGLFFAFCTIIGVIYAPGGNTLVSMGKWPVPLYYLPVMAGFTVLFYFILRRVLHRDYTLAEKPARNKLEEAFQRRPFMFSFIVLLAAWAPYLAICYPGNMTVDGAVQFLQALGETKLTNQNPVFGTLLLRAVFQLGRFVSDEFGVFTVVASQTVLTAAAVGICEKKILKLTRSISFSLVSLAYFAFVPIWGLYGTGVMKDVPFTAVFLLYAVSYVTLAEQLTDRSKKGKFDWKNAACLFVAGVLCSLMRHLEVFVVAASMVLLVIFAARDRWKTALLLLATVAVAVGGGRALGEVTETGHMPTADMFSIFFQQTARCMKRHGKSIKDSQYSTIDNVLDAETIGEVYDPLVADPVLDTYRENMTIIRLIRYFKLWIRLCRRRLVTHIDSFLQFSYSYIEPFHCADAKKVFYPDFSAANGLELRDSPGREYLVSFVHFYRETPVLQQTIFPGAHFWIGAVCCLLLWHKRRIRQSAVLFLPLLRTVMCLMSPAAGYLPYALPLLAITPLMLAWTRANLPTASGEIRN